MRRVYRAALPARVQIYLDRRARATTAQTVAREWRAARQTRALDQVVETLKGMSGPRERCMYCIDSHGSDIEHFWPKTRYPKKAFLWTNFLLCCSECGRFKGDCFPLDNTGAPMLIDPSAEDPWESLDFDPETGNLTARYDSASMTVVAKGERTVEVLRLDRREALSTGYRRTYLRLVACVRAALTEDAIDLEKLQARLRQLDDHGLMGWCFGPVGIRMSPFSELRRKVPDGWCAALKS